MKIRQTDKRSGRFVRENRSSNDIIFTKNLKIPKLHIILYSALNLWQWHVFLVNHTQREIAIEINTNTAKKT